MLFRSPAEQSAALAALAKRSMQIQVSIQDGTVWCHTAEANVELTLEPLLAA